MTRAIPKQVAQIRYCTWDFDGAAISRIAMETVMEGSYYTHAMWKVRPEREAEFVAAWQALSEVFSAPDGKPLWGSLLQSLAEPTVFISFGPWQNLSDVEAMRADPRVQTALAAAKALCVEASPGAYRCVAHVEVPR